MQWCFKRYNSGVLIMCVSSVFRCVCARCVHVCCCYVTHRKIASHQSEVPRNSLSLALTEAERKCRGKIVLTRFSRYASSSFLPCQSSLPPRRIFWRNKRVSAFLPPSTIPAAPCSSSTACSLAVYWFYRCPAVYCFPFFIAAGLDSKDIIP